MNCAFSFPVSQVDCTGLIALFLLPNVFKSMVFYILNALEQELKATFLVCVLFSFPINVFLSSYEALLIKLLNAFDGLWNSYSYFISVRQGGLTLCSVFFFFFSFIS